MKKEYAIGGAIGLLVGVAMTLLLATTAVNNDNHDMMRMMGMEVHTHEEAAGEGHTMDAMTSELTPLDGEAFDKKFLELMIEHHEGAVEMAALIPERTTREELKELGSAIQTTQTEEITMMKQWLKEWNLKTTDFDHMMEGHTGH